MTEGFTATVNWDFDNFTLTSITDYSTVTRDYIEDSDASPVPLFNFFLTTDAEQFSQEIRVSGSTDAMDWVAGVYYLDLAVDDSNGAETDPFIDPAGDTPDISGLDNPYETNTESWSIFGQVERRLSDNLTGILGARWIRDEKDHTYAVNVVDFVPGTVQRNGNPNILAQLALYNGEREDDEVSVRVALNYDLSEDVMIYGSWNRGVKGGGYNSPVFPLSPPLGYDDATMSYDPEQLDAFEVGFKSRLADGLAIFNGAAYYYDYKDYQAFQIIGLDTITTNANADSHGFELELQATPTEGLDVILGMAYNDIEVSLGDGPKTTSVQSPKWNLNGLVRYAWTVAGGELAAQVDALYRSSHFFSLTGLETVREDGYAITNASLSYTSAAGGFTVTGIRAQPGRCPAPRADLRPVGTGGIRHGRAVLQQAAVVGDQPGDELLRRPRRRSATSGAGGYGPELPCRPFPLATLPHADSVQRARRALRATPMVRRRHSSWRSL